MKQLFTSESVTEGHPDKLCDQVSDGVLDACLEQDPYSRVACETLVSTGMVVVAGEITSRTKVAYPDVVREAIRKIGYAGVVSFEYEKDADDPLAGLAESVGYVRGVLAVI